MVINIEESGFLIKTKSFFQTIVYIKIFEIINNK